MARSTAALEGTLAAGPIQVMLARSRLRFEGKGESLAMPQAKLGSLQITAMLADGGHHQAEQIHCLERWPVSG